MPEPCDPASVKKAIRDTARTRRAILPADDLRAKSAVICAYLLAELDGSRTVMVYISKPGEVSTRDLVLRLLASGRKVIVPIIERETTSLRLSYLRDPSVLVTSTFHVQEPIGSEIPARPADIDTVIVPMLAFDRCGNRLGYGAGYYDRFLPTIPRAAKIGLAFACQEVEAVPADARDVRMDRIITEQGILSCGPGS